ncbi:MAG: ATP-binding cassette, subfamily bacterial CvaB/MchF/RaxB [Sphingomonadales bacterium]|nr:ATP-binding cassette, subfamily bacterial CvaB/MchF/RaxB [Sphingomonadales bacterium]
MKAANLLRVSGGSRTPYIQQTEASECGLACLAMVAGFHGLKTDLPALRCRFSVSLKGTTLKVLISIAEQIGFHARPLRGELEHLHQIGLPAILHWDLNHFVVLTKVDMGLRGKRFHINDPNGGARVVGEAELSRHFTGVVLELMKSETFQPRIERSRLRIGQLWSQLSGLWVTLRDVLLLSLILQLISLASPFYLQLALDSALPSFDRDLLTVLALGFGGLVAIQVATGWLRSLILVSLGNSLSYQMVVNLYRHLMRLPLPWFERRHVGDIVSRFSSTHAISDLLSHGLISALLDGVMAFGTLALMFIYSPLLAMVAVIAWCLFALMKTGFIHALRLSNIDAITSAAKEESSFLECVRGIAAIKSFANESNRQRIWQQLKADAVNAQIKLGRLTAAFDNGGQFILGIERVLFVYLAIRLAMRGEFTVGMIFAFQAYKQQFLESATRLVEQGIQYRLLDVHLGRISDIALAKPEMPAQSLVERDEPVRGELSLHDVSFRYAAGDREVLRNVNLEIEPGQMAVLVGPSGGGKTTLLKIMMGLFRPTQGELLIDGEPANRHAASALAPSDGIGPPRGHFVRRVPGREHRPLRPANRHGKSPRGRQALCDTRRDQRHADGLRELHRRHGLRFVRRPNPARPARPGLVRATANPVPGRRNRQPRSDQ